MGEHEALGVAILVKCWRSCVVGVPVLASVFSVSFGNQLSSPCVVKDDVTMHLRTWKVQLGLSGACFPLQPSTIQG